MLPIRITFAGCSTMSESPRTPRSPRCRCFPRILGSHHQHVVLLLCLSSLLIRFLYLIEIVSTGEEDLAECVRSPP